MNRLIIVSCQVKKFAADGIIMIHPKLVQLIIAGFLMCCYSWHGQFARLVSYRLSICTFVDLFSTSKLFLLKMRFFLRKMCGIWRFYVSLTPEHFLRYRQVEMSQIDRKQKNFNLKRNWYHIWVGGWGVGCINH